MADAERFAALCKRLGLDLDAEQTYRDIVKHYRTPPRAYHDLNHVAECLAELDSARHLATDPDAVEVAIWYHDVILDNRQGDNELESAELAQETLLAGGASVELAAEVFTLIMATCHDAAPETEDARLMVDCDLAILGKDARRFDAYDAAIREEYAWVIEAVYLEKRAQVLEGFLARARIYLTDHFHASYDQQARTNLRRTVDRLISNF